MPSIFWFVLLPNELPNEGTQTVRLCKWRHSSRYRSHGGTNERAAWRYQHRLCKWFDTLVHHKYPALKFNPNGLRFDLAPFVPFGPTHAVVIDAETENILWNPQPIKPAIIYGPYFPAEWNGAAFEEAKCEQQEAVAIWRTKLRNLVRPVTAADAKWRRKAVPTSRQELDRLIVDPLSCKGGRRLAPIGEFTEQRLYWVESAPKDPDIAVITAEGTVLLGTTLKLPTLNEELLRKGCQWRTWHTVPAASSGGMWQAGRLWNSDLRRTFNGDRKKHRGGTAQILWHEDGSKRRVATVAAPKPLVVKLPIWKKKGKIVLDRFNNKPRLLWAYRRNEHVSCHTECTEKVMSASV